MKNKFFLSLFLILGCSAMTAAQDSETEFKKFQARIDLATFNTLDFGIEYGFSYSPIEYVGVSASLCSVGDFKSTGRSFYKDGVVYETNELHNDVWFRFGAQFRTPSLWRSADGKMRLRLQEEIGGTVSISPNKEVKCKPVGLEVLDVVAMNYSLQNKGGECIFFHSKTSVLFDINRWQISAGYTWSNMDVYSSTRDAAYKLGLELPAKKKLHGFHVGVGFSF